MSPVSGPGLVRPPAPAAHVSVPRIGGFGLLTGWGDGLRALETATPEPGAGLVAVPTPILVGERFRRATRECLLAVSAVRAALADAGLEEGVLAGERTGILYVSATGYAAANRAFLEDEGAATLHFPYTAPSAVPGEVTIEFGIRGPYVNLMGGGTAALQGLWYAATWLAEGVADRVLLLAVEAVHEVRDLFLRARRLYRGPLVEGAACLYLERGPAGEGDALAWASATAGGPRLVAAVERVLEAVLGDAVPQHVSSGVTCGGPGRVERQVLGRRGVVARTAGGTRLGEALACGPLIVLADAHARGVEGPWLVTAAWRNDYGALLWPRS